MNKGRSLSRHQERRDHLLAPRLELHRQLRSVGLFHVAVAEFVVEDALADLEAGLAGRGGDEGGVAFQGAGGLADAAP